MRELASLYSWLDQEVQQGYQLLRPPGLAVAISYKGERVFLTSGYADLAERVPYSMDTKFRIGSVNKVLTATALLILHEQGKLSLTDPVQKHLPFVRFRYKEKLREPIGLHHLLTHSSGLGEVRNGFDYWSTNLHYSVKHEDEINYEKYYHEPLSLGFYPGTQWYYSNHGFGLLGAVIERVTGMRYAQAMNVLLFQPLQLESMTVHNSQLQAPFAKSYAVKRKRFREAPMTEISMTAAGNTWSNFEDLLKYGEAINSSYLAFRDAPQKSKSSSSKHVDSENESLHVCNAQTLLKPWFTLHPKLSRQGLSYFLKPTDPLIARHGGTIDGFNSYFAIVPEHELVLAVSINRLNREHFFNWVDTFLARLLEKLGVTLRTPIPKPQESKPPVSNTSTSNKEKRVLPPSNPLPPEIPSSLLFTTGPLTVLYPRIITGFGTTLRFRKQNNRLYLYSSFKPLRNGVPLTYLTKQDDGYYFQFMLQGTPVTLILDSNHEHIYIERVELLKYMKTPPHPRSRVLEPLVYFLLNVMQ